MGDAFFVFLRTDRPKKWHSDSYETSPQTSEPVALIRAVLHNRSLCLFIFNFSYLLLILIFGEWGRIRQPVHTFRPPKLSRLCIISIGI